MLSTTEIVVFILILSLLFSCVCFLLGWWLGMIREHENYLFVALGVSKKECQEWILNRNSDLIREKLKKRFKYKSISEDEYNFYNKYINKLEKTWKEEENDRNRAVPELN